MFMSLLGLCIGIRTSNLHNIDFSVPLMKTEVQLLVEIKQMANNESWLNG